jgi:hypothetical protein
MFSPHTAFHDLHLHQNLRSILIQNDVFSYVWSICGHVLIHFGNEFGASEPDFLKVETSKPRKMVGPVELPQQLVTFLHELAQMLAQIEYMEMEVSNTLYFILFYFFLIEAINRTTIYKKKKKKKKINRTTHRN